MIETSARRTPGSPADQIGAHSDVPTQLLVLTTIALAGFNLTGPGGIPATLVAMTCVAPMWWPIVAQTQFVRAILGLAAATIVAGFVLAELAKSHHVVDPSVQRSSILIILGGLAIMLALVWGRSHFPLHVVAVVFGTGMLADAVLNSTRSWKYHLASPVAIIVVGWLGRYRQQLPAAGALLAIGVVTALDRGRSFFAFCTIAASLCLWQTRPTDPAARTRRWYPALLLVGAGAATYTVATRLLTQGYLGVEAQQRTISQIESSGSLITSGRPEWTATRALASERPWGYGLGVVPDARDYAVAKSGFDSINAQPGGYLTNYMLGGRFRLHSITADLWVSYGVVGVALAAIVAFALIRTISVLLAERRCPPIVALAVVLAMWHLAFGPIFTNWPDACFALGVTLLAREDLDRGETSPAISAERGRSRRPVRWSAVSGPD